MVYGIEDETEDTPEMRHVILVKAECIEQGEQIAKKSFSNEGIPISSILIYDMEFYFHGGHTVWI